MAEPGLQREVALAWAEEIAASTPLPVEFIRKTLREGKAERVRRALRRELSEQAWLCATEDSAEGIAAVAERREPDFHRG